jgi:hypothetical protein
MVPAAVGMSAESAICLISAHRNAGQASPGLPDDWPANLQTLRGAMDIDSLPTTEEGLLMPMDSRFGRGAIGAPA